MKKYIFLFFISLGLCVSCDWVPGYFDRTNFFPTEVETKIIPEKLVYKKNDTLKIVFSFKDEIKFKGTRLDSKDIYKVSDVFQRTDTIFLEDQLFLIGDKHPDHIKRLDYSKKKDGKIRVVKNSSNGRYETIDTLDIYLTQTGVLDLSKVTIYDAYGSLKPWKTNAYFYLKLYQYDKIIKVE